MPLQSGGSFVAGLLPGKNRSEEQREEEFEALHGEKVGGVRFTGQTNAQATRSGGALRWSTPASELWELWFARFGASSILLSAEVRDSCVLPPMGRRAPYFQAPASAGHQLCVQLKNSVN